MDSRYGAFSLFFFYFGRLRSKSASECKYEWRERSCDFKWMLLTPLPPQKITIRIDWHFTILSHILFHSICISPFVSLHRFPLQIPFFHFSECCVKLKLIFRRATATYRYFASDTVCVCVLFFLHIVNWLHTEGCWSKLPNCIACTNLFCRLFMNYDYRRAVN